MDSAVKRTPHLWVSVRCNIERSLSTGSHFGMHASYRRDTYPQRGGERKSPNFFRFVYEGVEPAFVISRHEMPVDVLRLVEVHEVHLLEMQCLEERVADEIHNIHEVLNLCAREEVEVADWPFPCNDRMPARDRERREARVHACILVDDRSAWGLREGHVLIGNHARIWFAM